MGLSSTTIYSIISLHGVWRQMLDRCSLGGSHSKNYYDRGIRVCRLWRRSEAHFIAWCLANGYAKGLQLDRENNNWHYCPSNCRWVTPSVNCRNRRSNVFLTAFGEQKTIADWVDDPRCVVTYHVLFDRIRHQGWAAEVAMTTLKGTVSSNHQLLTAFGESKSTAAWARDPRCVVSYAALIDRVATGNWTDLAAITTATHDPKSHEAFGERKSLLAWSKDARCAVSYGTLHRRVMVAGWQVQQALTTAKRGH